MRKRPLALWIIAILVTAVLFTGAAAEDDFALELPADSVAGQGAGDDEDIDVRLAQNQDEYWTESGREALWNALNTGSPQPLSVGEKEDFFRRYAVMMEVWKTIPGTEAEKGSFVIREDGGFYADYEIIDEEVSEATGSICRGMISDVYRLSDYVYALIPAQVVWERADDDFIVQEQMLFQAPGASAGEKGILTYETGNVAETLGVNPAEPVPFCLVTAFDSSPLWYGIPKGQAIPGGNGGAEQGNAPAALAGGWECPACGQGGNTGNFCTNCGTAQNATPDNGGETPDAGGTAPDQGSAAPEERHTGGAEDAYAAVLEEHTQAIHHFQETELKWWDGPEMLTLPGKPAGLTDLTGDGIRELLFLEMKPGSDSVDLLIWTAGRGGAEQVFSLARAALVDNAFPTDLNIYRIRDGSVVIEYETDGGWGVVRLGNDSGSLYIADKMTREDDGLQGQTDPCTRNGKEIPVKTYQAVLAEWQGGKSVTLCAFPRKEEKCFGFGSTYEEAMASLGQKGSPVLTDPPAGPVTVTSPPDGERVMKTAKGNTNVRKSASKSSGKVTTLAKKGTEVTILDETEDDSGQVWYYIRTSKGKEGYIRGDLLEP